MLTEANQKEYNSLLPSVASSNSTEVTQLKSDAEKLVAKAEEVKNNANASSNSTDKNSKLVEANKLYQ